MVVTPPLFTVDDVLLAAAGLGILDGEGACVRKPPFPVVGARVVALLLAAVVGPAEAVNAPALAEHGLLVMTPPADACICEYSHVSPVEKYARQEL